MEVSRRHWISEAKNRTVEKFLNFLPLLFFSFDQLIKTINMNGYNMMLMFESVSTLCNDSHHFKSYPFCFYWHVFIVCCDGLHRQCISSISFSLTIFNTLLLPLRETSLLFPIVSFLFHSTYISGVYMYECVCICLCVSVNVSMYVCVYSLLSLYNI